MKNSILLLSFFIILMFFTLGCEKNETISLKDWEAAYISQLQALYSGKVHPQNLYKKEERDDFDDEEWKDMEFSYCIKDINNDNIPELLINNNRMNVTVYTFDGSIVKVGNIDFRTATTKFLYSNNLSYPGIFFFWVGGGYNHYGYVYIKDNELVEEELWDEDFSGISKEQGKDREEIEEYSDDKQQIKESKIAYSDNNDISFKKVHPDNFSQGLSILLEESDKQKQKESK